MLIIDSALGDLISHFPEMQAYPEGDVRSLSAAELLAGQGSSMVVFHPSAAPNAAAAHAVSEATDVAARQHDCTRFGNPGMPSMPRIEPRLASAPQAAGRSTWAWGRTPRPSASPTASPTGTSRSRSSSSSMLQRSPRPLRRLAPRLGHTTRAERQAPPRCQRRRACCSCSCRPWGPRRRRRRRASVSGICRKGSSRSGGP